MDIIQVEIFDLKVVSVREGSRRMCSSGAVRWMRYYWSVVLESHSLSEVCRKRHED